jgi:hypothetical protein
MLEKFSRHEKFRTSAWTGLELSRKNSHPLRTANRCQWGTDRLNGLNTPGWNMNPPR